MLVIFLEKRGSEILNRGTVRDEKMEYIFTGGRGNSVIDYVLGEEGIRKKVKRLYIIYIEERVNSDHHQVEVWIKREKEKKKEGGGEKKVKGWRGVWTEKRSKKFERRIKEKRIDSEKVGLEINDKWKEIKRNVKRSGEGVLNGEKKKKQMDKKCEERKKKVRRELRKWRKKGGKGEEYRKKKRSI